MGLAQTPDTRFAIVAVAALTGVAIDIDHFVIARLETGEWTAVRRVLADPARAFIRQDEIFGPEAVGPTQRLVSHLIVGGAGVGVTLVVAPTLAVVVGAVLAVHVLADAYADIERRGAFPWQG